MQTFYQLLALLGAGLIVWWMYRTIKHRPDQFNRQNLSKSFSTMGILALILIAFVAFLVMILRYA
ncbi:MAG: hypothetical protein CMF38_07670 [Legionellaceae bacterium]|nr:hypothetical protein [Legionellaceae bacterium]MBJ16491.1 hypothetical protein [Legionellaceae bacterium]HAF87152.1 hypothetical protein [Legionellales bacterium]HCA89888.1 hypothetical protein [Legionellales bacterium]|tara:strand:- start:1101 stop:1295 length:195 start_codon:yes stop_codon:yes gene_type:complete